MSALPTSELVFTVCDAIGDAYRAGTPLSPDAMHEAQAMLRQAAVDVRIMEEALNRHVADALAGRAPRAVPLRVIEGGRTA